MQIHYRILSVDQKEHSMVVRYWTDALSEDSLASFFDEQGNIRRGDDNKPLRCRTDYNLNMFDPNATPEQLDKYIENCAPTQWFKMLEEAAKGPTPAVNHVTTKLNIDHSFEHVPPQQPTVPKTLIETEIEDILKHLDD